MIPRPIAQTITILETNLKTKLQDTLMKDAHSIRAIFLVCGCNYWISQISFIRHCNVIACKYIINKESVVRERGCGGVGVTSRVSFCTNRFKDVLICYCTTDWCNGVDSSNSAVNAAQEHFRRQEELEKKETKVNNAAAIGVMLTPWLALIMVLNSICGWKLCLK